MEGALGRSPKPKWVKIMTKNEIMRQAHKKARQMKENGFKSYRAALTIGMNEAWREYRLNSDKGMALSAALKAAKRATNQAESAWLDGLGSAESLAEARSAEAAALSAWTIYIR
jgi:hypothetical protein